MGVPGSYRPILGCGKGPSLGSGLAQVGAPCPGPCVPPLQTRGTSLDQEGPRASLRTPSSLVPSGRMAWGAVFPLVSSCCLDRQGKNPLPRFATDSGSQNSPELSGARAPPPARSVLGES